MKLSLENQLVRLGATNPELRPHIRPLLKQANWAVNIEMTARKLAMEVKKGEDGNTTTALIAMLEVLRMFMIRDLGYAALARRLVPITEALTEMTAPLPEGFEDRLDKRMQGRDALRTEYNKNPAYYEARPDEFEKLKQSLGVA